PAGQAIVCVSAGRAGQEGEATQVDDEFDQPPIDHPHPVDASHFNVRVWVMAPVCPDGHDTVCVSAGRAGQTGFAVHVPAFLVQLPDAWQV
ncbi:hypothetical protein, partial [Rhodoferax sp.]|uniref:hypothetical protein n=1 Tax=Rhodoferax sp. TaxID=50421 RepID=UPI0026248AE2